jgi:hypothetical protein
VVPEVRHSQVAQQQAAIGVRIGAHAPLALRGQGRDVRVESAVGVEQLRRAIAFQPALQDLQMSRVRHVGHRHLMGAKGAFGRPAVHTLRSGPALGRAQDDHGPARTGVEAEGAGIVLDALDLGDHGIERGGHQLVHRHGIIALDDIGLVTIALEQRLKLIAGDACEHRGTGDLVAVEVQDGQHGAVVDRVEELVRMPARRQRTGLRLAVADHAGDDQIRIVEGRAEGMRQRIAQLAALVDRPRRVRRDMAGDAAGKGELLEQPLHPVLIPGDVRIDLAVGAFQVGVRHHRRPAVTRPGDIDHA